jgi:hypothetical protein
MPLLAAVAVAGIGLAACGSGTSAQSNPPIGGLPGGGAQSTPNGNGPSGNPRPTSAPTPSQRSAGVCAYLDNATASQVAGAPVTFVSGTGAVGGESLCIYGNSDQGATMTMQVTSIHGDAKTGVETVLVGMQDFQAVPGIGDAAAVAFADTVVEFAFAKGELLVVISADGGTGAEPGAVEKRVEAFARQVAGVM